MDEEKERPACAYPHADRQKEVKEKLEDAGLDPDEFDEGEQPACAEPACRTGRASAGREELADLL